MDWKYYKHAMIPDTWPHEVVDTSLIQNGKIWKRGGGAPLFARWTSDFDCGYETNWWYCIKDTPFEIEKLKAKRRYEVNKGRKNFDVSILSGEDFDILGMELYSVYLDSLMGYPEANRNEQNETSFLQTVNGWKACEECRLFVAIDRESGQVCGYADVYERGRYLPISSLKTRPQCEKYNVNFALVDGILAHYEDRLRQGTAYLCDGARNLVHQTAFQDFLEKYFGFRKAYCRLNMAYHPLVGWLIKLLVLFDDYLKKFDNVGLIHMVNAVLQMEKIARLDKAKGYE